MGGCLCEGKEKVQKGNVALLSVTEWVTLRAHSPAGSFSAPSPTAWTGNAPHWHGLLCPRKAVVLLEQGCALSEQHVPIPPWPGKLCSRNLIVTFVLTPSVLKKCGQSWEWWMNYGGWLWPKPNDRKQKFWLLIIQIPAEGFKKCMPLSRFVMTDNMPNNFCTMNPWKTSSGS